MGRETREFDAPEVLDGTIVLQLGYDGTGYSGFAEQPGQTTVAGEIRRAVETFLRRPIELTCAGRTDAGVHAISQYVSFSATAAELEITRSRWMRALVALLPRDIAVREVWHAAPGFSARFDARSRTYTYRIATGDAPPLLTRSVTWWHRQTLDVEAMHAAAQRMLGERDFEELLQSVFCRGQAYASLRDIGGVWSRKQLGRRLHHLYHLRKRLFALDGPNDCGDPCRGGHASARARMDR